MIILELHITTLISRNNNRPLFNNISLNNTNKIFNSVNSLNNNKGCKNYNKYNSIEINLISKNNFANLTQQLKPDKSNKKIDLRINRGFAVDLNSFYNKLYFY